MPTQLQRVQPDDWPGVLRNFDNLAQAVNPPVPQARVFNSANISVANNTLTALTFDSERFDNGGLHSTSANTSRLTAPVTGLYSIGADVRFAANATGVRQAQLRVNGATTIASVTYPVAAAASASDLLLDAPWQLTAADYVEVMVFQDSGGALNVTAASALSPEFWMVRLGGFVNQGV